MLQSFKNNLTGKDYICSDIHGHFYILEAELNRVGFNEQVDRLFCLGDLIDRGDESALALEWLQKPWFFAIQGNHERMLINAFESDSEILWRQWMMWGGDWAEDMDRESLAPFYEAFKKLPIAIELALANNKRAGLVHAELPDVCDWNDVRHLLFAMAPEKIEATREISDMLWKKSQTELTPENVHRVEPVANIDHVFHGHTIVDDYLTIANRTFADLGAYRTGKIGLLEPVAFLWAEPASH